MSGDKKQTLAEAAKEGAKMTTLAEATSITDWVDVRGGRRW